MLSRSKNHPNNTPYEVIRALSTAGRLPQYEEALPTLGEAEHGKRMGVGSANMHMVFRFNYDNRSQSGKWNYLYSEENGIEVKD
jgi:hypothetical protein